MGNIIGYLCASVWNARNDARARKRIRITRQYRDSHCAAGGKAGNVNVLGVCDPVLEETIDRLFNG